MIPPLHDTTQPEAGPPQAQPLGLQGGDEHEGQQARAGGEEADWRGRRLADGGDRHALGVVGGGALRCQARDGVGGRDLERGGAVVELVVQHLGVGAGDLEVAQGVGVQAVYAGRAGCYVTCEGRGRGQG